jgi:predicted Ser/Thr protein kinase
MALSTGSRLGPYEIVALLGSGGMGEVYEAADPRLRRHVALKILPEAVARDVLQRERFEREAQTIAALSHPNIVTIYSVEQADGIQFLTMELAKGRPLGSLIPPRGLPLHRLLQLAVPVADAISAAHARGITHRDLKPDNIVVTDDDRVKVLDFGIAKVTDRAGGALDAMTRGLPGDGRIVGTIAYMSPEQVPPWPRTRAEQRRRSLCVQVCVSPEPAPDRRGGRAGRSRRSARSAGAGEPDCSRHGTHRRSQLPWGDRRAQSCAAVGRRLCAGASSARPRLSTHRQRRSRYLGEPTGD